MPNSIKRGLTDLKESLELKKRQLLRNNEYYAMQDLFDKLHNQSCKKYKFQNLLQHITSEKNILLAYRNIKNNKGSTTVGTDDIDISHYKEMETGKFIKYIQDKFVNYQPKNVKRVEIPKPNGKTRPLGIPCMDDRIIQQCIKQVLEPILEAKFHKHSYGFRPNRATKHAIARCMFLINRAKLHYVVDIDIKGFFDNVNHNKLKKQLWGMGIQDKNLLRIIDKMLKSEIQNIGIPTKGVPQGGLVSPLLSNVVLNELDWWISSQWETFETGYQYKQSESKYYAIRKSNLKEIWLVRYADDFKIFCRDYNTARKIFIATEKWLKERLDLDISKEKSKITNVRKNRTEFLGFSLIAKKKRNKYVCQSFMCDSAKKSTINNIKAQIKCIQRMTTKKEVEKLNAIILGSHNYYKSATNVSIDFGDISFLVTKTLEIRLKGHISDKPKLSETYKRLYGNHNGKTRTIKEITIFPIHGCKTKPPMCFSQNINNYTTAGRNHIHNELGDYSYLIEYLLNDTKTNESVELSDNKISLIAGQQGKCFVTGKQLEIGNMKCHHRKQPCDGGTNEYKNLVWICTEAYNLVHSTQQEIINKYQSSLALDEKGLKRVNSLRKQVGNLTI